MFLTCRFYLMFIVVALLTACGHLWSPLHTAGLVGLAMLALAVLSDARMLYARRGLELRRSCAERFSNGDDNPVEIRVENTYSRSVAVNVVDETPFIFQRRDVLFPIQLRSGEGKTIRYMLRPVKRGVYGFGHIRAFVRTRLGLVERRYTGAQPQDVKVYPSFLRLNRYELLAAHDELTEQGMKRIRRVGHHTEFEHIRAYVSGDDYRSINWKASARRHDLMVNVYQDEKSQQIYNLIDKGRVMQQTFRGMTLLDYAINASLVLSHISMRKEDKAGLLTFAETMDTFVAASREQGHLQTLLENLYNQQTLFGETDFSALCVHAAKHINKRSLLVLYTNFATIGSLNRQLPYLRQLNRRQRLLVVFFEDTEMKKYLETPAGDTEDYYRHVIAEKFMHEKQLIASVLKQNGIYALLTAPENLSVDVINKYLELKSRQAF